MSDVNELIHAIRLAERLAEGVAREDEGLSSEHLVNVRKSLAAATIHIEMAALWAGVDLIDDHAILDDRLRRAMTAIAAEKGVEVEEDPYASLDETEIEFADGTVVQLKAKEADLRILATKLREGEREAQQHRSALRGDLDRAKLALARYGHDVRDGLRPADVAEKRTLKLALLEAKHALLLEEHSRKSQAA